MSDADQFAATMGDAFKPVWEQIDEMQRLCDRRDPVIVERIVARDDVIRFDNQEPATSVFVCKPRHFDIAKRFNDLLALSLLHPTDRRLVDVVADLLDEAAKVV